MDRPRLTSARLRARREDRYPPAPAPGEGDASWLEWGGTEIRLHGGTGGVVWSRALPDPALGLGRLEFAARELEGLERDDEEDAPHEHA